MSRANPVMLSGTGSRLRYAGSCTFTMRATLSSTILARGVRSRSSPAAAALSGRSAAPALRAEAAGGRSKSQSARRAGLRARGAEVTRPAPIGSGRVTCAGAGAEDARAAAGSERVGSGASLGLDFEEGFGLGPFTSVEARGQQEGYCIRCDKARESAL